MDYAIEVYNLTKKYPGFTLDNINLQIPSGRIVGLVGENGAGKTTLISLILNQLKRDTGNIRIFGKDNIREEYRIKQEIGFLVDECCFHYCLNANNIRNIMRSIYKKWDDAEFDSFLAKLQINSKKKVTEMSKGMKNKLMLAVALSHKLSILNLKYQVFLHKNGPF